MPNSPQKLPLVVVKQSSAKDWGVIITGATASSTNIGTVSANVVGRRPMTRSSRENPVRVAARALTAAYASVATGDVADLVATLQEC